MKTEAEIRQQYEWTKAKLEEYQQKLNAAIDNLGRFPVDSRDDKIAWDKVREFENESRFYAIRLGTLMCILDMPVPEWKED